jgi:putative glutamine amidotransferase
MRPVIGITTYREDARWGTWHRPADLIAAVYTDAILAAGGCPVLLPPIGGVAAEVVSRVDGLLLAGGADIDPTRYAAVPHETVTVVRPDRDASELELLDAAIAAHRPVLGVCRGAQILNVAAGGDLVQHLPDVLDGVNHRLGPGEFVRQRVRLLPGSRLATALGDAVDVDCYHHQAINRLGTGLAAVGSADDGTIEAVELADRDFVIGVQWHPEESTDLRLFASLVAAARASS